MIALWMLYATVIGCLLAAAAHALEQVAAERGWPRRWVWLAAILALPLVPLLTSEVPQPQPTAAVSPSAVSGTVSDRLPAAARPRTAANAAARPSVRAPESVASRISRSFATAYSALDLAALPAAAAVRQAQARLPNLERFDGWLVAFWVLLSALLLASYAVAAVKLASRRQRWPTARLDGETVLLSPDAGPAVVGTIHPAIVLPTWSLAIDPPARALILTHEREHMRARDPLMLHLVTVIAYLVPWNLPVWWMLRRLRIAIEVDCDLRVLRAGHDAHRYADLLLAVGSRRSITGRALVPALVERKSLLARRILAMCPRRSRFRHLRLTCSAGAAYMLVATAYAIPMPSISRFELPLPNNRMRWNIQFDLSGIGFQGLPVDSLKIRNDDSDGVAIGNLQGNPSAAPPRTRRTPRFDRRSFVETSGVELPPQVSDVIVRERRHNDVHPRFEVGVVMVGDSSRAVGQLRTDTLHPVLLELDSAVALKNGAITTLLARPQLQFLPADGVLCIAQSGTCTAGVALRGRFLGAEGKALGTQEQPAPAQAVAWISTNEDSAGIIDSSRALRRAVTTGGWGPPTELKLIFNTGVHIVRRDSSAILRIRGSAAPTDKVPARP